MKEAYEKRTADMMDRLQEHHQWVLRYDEVMEYWMVCRETAQRMKVLAHSRDIMEAVELALDDEARDS